MVSSRQLMALRSLLVVVIACYLGSECRVQARSSSCLAAEVQSWWCCQDVDNTVRSAVVLRLRVLRLCLRGFEHGRQAAWRPWCNRGGVVKMLMALCSLLLVLIVCYLGSVCGVQARLSS